MVAADQAVLERALQITYTPGSSGSETGSLTTCAQMQLIWSAVRCKYYAIFLSDWIFATPAARARAFIVEDSNVVLYIVRMMYTDIKIMFRFWSCKKALVKSSK